VLRHEFEVEERAERGDEVDLEPLPVSAMFFEMTVQSLLGRELVLNMNREQEPAGVRAGGVDRPIAHERVAVANLDPASRLNEVEHKHEVWDHCLFAT
jgi:hypothetical protein